MAKGAFQFLRATYWRWAETIHDVCPELADAPQVLAVGDIHLENFGTWRDVDGRLVWGVNDFDEADATCPTCSISCGSPSVRCSPTIRGITRRTICDAHP